ncbi:MAG TPA: TPM domain-containing protein [Ktedonobacterales bacterium]|nr:TPM domain-containing protein [Ktedonobacterales bacterium]
MSPHHSSRARHRAGRWWPAVTAMLATLMAFAALVFGVTGTAIAAPAADCAGPVAGRHIYDCAGLLTPAEITTLEGRAAAVERAGAPAVVYLQAKDATAAQTYQDAGDLMNRWNIQSAPDARDGFVMFLNLQPGNLRHGQVILFAGAKHLNDGTLPQSELTRIYTDAMLPLLRAGDTAGGIGAGLDAVAADLSPGAPATTTSPPAATTSPLPSQAPTVIERFGRVLFNVLALLYLLVLAVVALRSWRFNPEQENAGPLRGRRASAGGALDHGVLRPPDSLAPALVGALVTGRVRDEQIEGTILDFAHRGLLALEPVEAHDVQLRLLRQAQGDHAAGLSEFERAVWQGLLAEANDQDVVTEARLPAVRLRWQQPKSLLRDELVARGWYLRHTPVARPLLHVLGAVGASSGFIGVLIAVAASDTWTLLGMLLLGAGGAAAFKLGTAISDATDDGAQVAVPWRAYLAGAKAVREDHSLDEALPYMVAAGMASAVTDHLWNASATGYSPAWFRAHDAQWARSVGFYPYWTTFHSCMYPVTHGGAGAGGYAAGTFSAGGFGGGGGGGAAGGGGGAGGGF